MEVLGDSIMWGWATRSGLQNTWAAWWDTSKISMELSNIQTFYNSIYWVLCVCNFHVAAVWQVGWRICSDCSEAGIPVGLNLCVSAHNDYTSPFRREGVFSLNSSAQYLSSVVRVKLLLFLCRCECVEMAHGWRSTQGKPFFCQCPSPSSVMS